MVNVTAKPFTLRRALARCEVVCGTALEDAGVEWSELLATARIAAIQAAKQTAALIPLCHPLPLESIEVRFHPGARAIAIEAESVVVAQTGVEMEALTACAVAALTLVVGLRRTDPLVSVERLELVEKLGGRSGHWTRPEPPES